MPTPTDHPTVDQPAATVLSDRWGDPLDAVPHLADLAAISRLAPALVGYGEFAFVARDSSGDYGLLVEAEVPWNQSDDEDGTIEVYWGGTCSATEQVRAARGWAARIAAAHPGLVDAVASGDDVFFGRLGVQVFIPERHAAGAAGAVMAAIDAGIHPC